MNPASNPSNATSHKEPISDTPPRIGKWTEIGEVKITQTRFGKVKVQVVTEENNRLRNSIMLLILLLAFAVAAWQAWQVWHQPEGTSNTEITDAGMNNEAEKQSLSKSGTNPRAPGHEQQDYKPVIPLTSGNTIAVTNQKSTSQQTQSLKAADQNAAVSSKQAVDVQPAAQPATEPIPAKVMPSISPVANPSAVPPEKSFTASPTPAGNIQPHVTPDTKP